MTPARILAVDVGTSTGFAHNCRASLESGTVDFAIERGTSPGVRFLRFRKWLTELVADLRPALLVYERAHHRGGYGTEVGVGLTTRVEEVAAEFGIEHVAIHSGTLKLWATGHGNAKKPAMQIAAARFDPWYDAKADPGGDQADAILLLQYAAAGFPETKPARPVRKRPAKRAADPQARLSLTTK